MHTPSNTACSHVSQRTSAPTASVCPGLTTQGQLSHKSNLTPPHQQQQIRLSTLLQKVRSFAAAAMWCSDAHVPPSSRPRGPCLSAHTRAHAAKGGRARERAMRAACSSSDMGSHSSCVSSSESAGHTAVSCVTRLSAVPKYISVQSWPGRCIAPFILVDSVICCPARECHPTVICCCPARPCHPTLLCACPGFNHAVSCCVWP